MSNFFVLVPQAGLVALEAAWLTIAAANNLSHPGLNERGFFTVLGMIEVKHKDQETYREFAYRRVLSPRFERFLFWLVVTAETIVCVLLWLSALVLLLAALGAVGHPAARAFATLSVLGFTAIWAGLLIGGEWFIYWVGMTDAQHTHMLLLLWGVATLAFLAAAP